MSEGGSDRKAEFVRDLFSGVPAEYDWLLSLLTFRRDAHWRRTVLHETVPSIGRKAIDLATETGLLGLRLTTSSFSRTL